MKKIISILLYAICTILALSSCKNDRNINYSEIKQNAFSMMECVVDENASGLFDFYGKDLKINYADKFLKEIEQLFDYIDGRIISYEYKGKGGGQETIHDGEICYYTCYPEFDFTTNTGKAYTIEFGLVYIYKEKPESEGVYMIQICENGNWGEKLAIGDTYNKE